jgi:hypothetical protein
VRLSLCNSNQSEIYRRVSDQLQTRAEAAALILANRACDEALRQKGLNLLCSAARGGSAAAQVIMGDLLISGDGVERDLVAGRAWLELVRGNYSALASRKIEALSISITKEEEDRAKAMTEEIIRENP